MTDEDKRRGEGCDGRSQNASRWRRGGRRGGWERGMRRFQPVAHGDTLARIFYHSRDDLEAQKLRVLYPARGEIPCRLEDSVLVGTVVFEHGDTGLTDEADRMFCEPITDVTRREGNARVDHFYDTVCDQGSKLNRCESTLSDDSHRICHVCRDPCPLVY